MAYSLKLCETQDFQIVLDSGQSQLISLSNDSHHLRVVVSIILEWSEGVYCPHYCRCMVSNGLRHVRCVGQGLISVELDVPRTVQWLELSNNSIYELRDYIFEEIGQEHIVELNLDNNAIQSIGLNAFAGLRSLDYLDLSGNHLYYLPLATFQHNPILAYLSLQGNPLRYFRTAFLKSNSISVLDISNCRLNYLPSVSFAALPALTKINISRNHIDSLSVNTFGNLTKLIELDISYNKLHCEEPTHELESWVNSKGITLTGSPCHIESEVPSPIGGSMFERMIVMSGLSRAAEFDEPEKEECLCNGTGLHRYLTDSTDSKGYKRNDRNKIQMDYNPLFLLLAFVNGIIVGMAFTLSVWVCSRWLRAKYMRPNPAYDVIQYDGPPPAYSDLF